MHSGNLSNKIAPPSRLFSTVAETLVQKELGDGSDLSSVVVLLPNLFACGHFTQILADSCPRTCMFPKITTLERLTRNSSIEVTEKSNSFFIAEIYSVLKEENFTRGDNLWMLATDIFHLFNEITLNSGYLHEKDFDFQQYLARAVSKINLRPLQYEATLISKMWEAFWCENLNPLEQVVDAAGAKMLRLRSLTKKLSGPIYAVGLPELDQGDQNFFRSYSRNFPVYFYQMGGWIDGATENENFFHQAIISCFDKTPQTTSNLKSREHRWKKNNSLNFSNVKIVGLKGLEREASVVVRQIERWINTGLKKIALVGLDNVSARRIRALLERRNIFLQDELGWLFSTTSASTIILRWLDICSNSFSKASLLDVTKSPFFNFPGISKTVLYTEICDMPIDYFAKTCIADYVKEAKKNQLSANTILVLSKIESLVMFFNNGATRSLTEWLSRLEHCLDALEISDRLNTDIAGRQLIDLLNIHRLQLLDSAENFSLSEWRQWLNNQFETNQFYDSEVTSPVVLTTLNNTRLRYFEAVAVVGCDTSHLPGQYEDLSILSNSLRNEIGLPGDLKKVKRVGENLFWLFSLNVPIIFTWQREKDGNPNGLGAILEIINLQKITIDGKKMILDAPQRSLDSLNIAHQLDCDPVINSRAEVVLPKAVIPKKISNSSYQSLLDCPFQYFARYVLGLSESQQRERYLDKSKYGELIHRVLYEFHNQVPVVKNVDPQDAKKILWNIFLKYFDDITGPYLVLMSWRFESEELLNSYLDWQIERENKGWFYHEGEVPCEKTIKVKKDIDLIATGRIDRIDRNNLGQKVVIDYKTSPFSKLKSYVNEPHKNVQLLFYCFLSSEILTHASYVGLNKKNVEDFGLKSEVNELAKKNVERLLQTFGDLHDGIPLPANGSDAICEFCKMRGVCRKKTY